MGKELKMEREKANKIKIIQAGWKKQRICGYSSAQVRTACCLQALGSLGSFPWRQVCQLCHEPSSHVRSPGARCGKAAPPAWVAASSWQGRVALGGQ